MSRENSETLADIRNVKIKEIGIKIIVDLLDCRLCSTKQIVMLHILREQGIAKNKQAVRPVDVLVTPTEMRSFFISEQIDSLVLHNNILSCRILQVFAGM